EGGAGRVELEHGARVDETTPLRRAVEDAVQQRQFSRHLVRLNRTKGVKNLGCRWSAHRDLDDGARAARSAELRGAVEEAADLNQASARLPAARRRIECVTKAGDGRLRADIEPEHGARGVGNATGGRAVQRAVAAEQQRGHWRREPVREIVNAPDISGGRIEFENRAAPLYRAAAGAEAE